MKIMNLYYVIFCISLADITLTLAKKLTET